jgi:hypothetical protein
MKKRILQKIADRFISKIENSSDEETFNFYMEMALWLDLIAINHYDIYLD